MSNSRIVSEIHMINLFHLCKLEPSFSYVCQVLELESNLHANLCSMLPNCDSKSSSATMDDF